MAEAEEAEQKMKEERSQRRRHAVDNRKRTPLNIQEVSTEERQVAGTESDTVVTPDSADLNVMTAQLLSLDGMNDIEDAKRLLASNHYNVDDAATSVLEKEESFATLLKFTGDADITLTPTLTLRISLTLLKFKATQTQRGKLWAASEIPQTRQ